jgi:hypothetical protein
VWRSLAGLVMFGPVEMVIGIAVGIVAGTHIHKIVGEFNPIEQGFWEQTCSWLW